VPNKKGKENMIFYVIRTSDPYKANYDPKYYKMPPKPYADCFQTPDFDPSKWEHKMPWSIELNSFEELVELAQIAKHGLIVIPPEDTDCDVDLPILEIYDGYRE
jgi:hypothetical protein